jgi:hypothetical protein
MQYKEISFQSERNYVCYLELNVDCTPYRPCFMKSFNLILVQEKQETRFRVRVIYIFVR